jgi:hypothetical protein
MKTKFKANFLVPGVIAASILFFSFPASAVILITRSPLDPATAQTVSFGKGTSALFSKTNAAFAVPGTVSIINNGTVDPISGFVAPVPEPGFYGILAAGLSLLFVAVKFRRKQISKRLSA